METDAEDEQAFALLKSLASAGAQAFAPAAPVLGVLDRLGASLLSSGTDDIEFRYSFVLDPSGGYKGTVYATTEAGDYVFMRTENREADVDWSKLFLDHITGRVWVVRGDVKELYRENTYLTVQVLRNAGSEMYPWPRTRSVISATLWIATPRPKPANSPKASSQRWMPWR
jgi:hypothetical protein